MRITILMVFVLTTASPVFSQSVTDGSESRISSAELRLLYKVLPDFLKDPASAQFTKLHKDPNNGDYICGFVNAKNGMGGYTGTQPFRFGIKNEMLITGMNSPC